MRRGGAGDWLSVRAGRDREAVVFGLGRWEYRSLAGNPGHFARGKELEWIAWFDALCYTVGISGDRVIAFERSVIEADFGVDSLKKSRSAVMMSPRMAGGSQNF